MPIHDPYYFNILANPSGNRQLDDMERAYKLRQDVDRCEDLESEEKAMVNLAAQEYDAMKIVMPSRQRVKLADSPLAEGGATDGVLSETLKDIHQIAVHAARHKCGDLIWLC